MTFFDMIKRNIKFKNNRIKIVAALLCAIIVFLIVWCTSAAIDGFGLGEGKTVMANIPKGANISEITDILKNEGIIRHKLLFRVAEKIDKAPHVFQLGGHYLKTGMSYFEIIDILQTLPDVGVNDDVKVLIPEGYETWQIAEAFEKAGVADKEKFLKELEEGEFDYDFINKIERKKNRLEGYLFPATYEIATYESEHEIIERMLKKFSEVVLPIYNSTQTEYSLDEVVTLASLIEREAANDSERTLVSSVFHNRMKKDMTLSSCASVQYIIKERKPILSNSDIKIKSDYNTYINKGLPIGPIASPGEKSFIAALNPSKTDYLYFAAKMDGSANVFSRTGEEHLRVVNQIQGK